MKLCPECQRCYEDAEANCLVDSTRLVAARLGSRDIADGKYRLDRRIGRGGMGAVYAGTHVELERPVAIKLLLSDYTNEPQALERFRREARAAARLNHPNIADTYDYGMLIEGGAYIVMELLNGVTLRERLNEQQAIHCLETLVIVRQVALGIEAAHRRGIIHRDLKPANIMLTQNEHDGLLAVVLDFGIAKLREQTLSGALTNTGMLIGTPRYMSPEQCAGVELDPRSDIYSLGVIFYEILARRPPFDAPTAMAIALKHMHNPPVSLIEISPELPPELASLCMKMLSKDPTARPQTAAELAQHIANLQVQLGDAGNAAWQPSDATTRLHGATPNTFGEINANDYDASGQTNRTNVPTVEEAIGVKADANFSSTPQASTHSLQDSTLADKLNSRRSFLLIGVAVCALVIGSISFFALRPPSSKSDSDNEVTNRQSAAKADNTVVEPSPINAESPVNAENVTPTKSETNTLTPDAIAAPPAGDKGEVEVLRRLTEDWVAATNKQDIVQQMSFYPPRITRYYRLRNVTRQQVEQEKQSLFSTADSITMTIGALQVEVRPNKRTAITRFHKRYTIQGSNSIRSGEVVQELEWTLMDNGWKITGERDVRVIG